MPTWLLILALIWPLFWVIRVLLVSKALLGLEFRRQQVVAVPLAEIPPHLREATQPWVMQLEALGFGLLGGWRVEWAGEPAFDEEAIVLVRGTHPIRAVIRPHGEAVRSGECWVSLRTTTGAGFEIITASHAPEQLVPLPPGMEVEVIATNTMSELLQRHTARIAAVAPGAWVCEDLENAVLREQYLCDGSFAHLGASGLLAEREGGSYSYRAWPAAGRAVQILRHAAAQKKARAVSKAPAAPELSVESRTTFDLRHYRGLVAMQRGRFSLRTKAVITVVSFLLFAAALAWRMSPVVAVTLLVALVFHECGHLLGMRLFGYRDTQLLFVPFFGGAAVGHDDKVLKPWQHIVIILLGPLPGIFIGLAMLAYQTGGGPAWLKEAALTTVVLNAFNLLPILPLDGGQIVDFAVASRFPRARVLFLAGSALGLLLVGLLPGTSLVIGVAVVMLLRLPVEWRLAGVRRDVREEFPDGGEEEPIVRRLLEHVREPEWKKTPMAQRLVAVRGLQQVLRMPRPGFGTMVFALAGFTAPLWLGAPLAVWAAIRQGEARVQQAEARAEAAGLMAPAATAPAAAITEQDNAAVPYAKAEALANEDLRARATKAAHEAEIVALLREATHRKAFVPIPDAVTPNGGGRKTFLAVWGHGGIVNHLTQAAQERLRFQEPVEAAALAIDALWLVRLMDAAPGWLNWSMHQELVENSWGTVEEALAAGAKLSPRMMAELRALSAEEPVIAFAAGAIPRGMVGQMNFTNAFAAQGGGSAGLRLFMALQQLNPELARLRTEAINQAIMAQGYLQAIQRGEWPQPVADAKGANGALMSVAQLGDVLARQRQARVAIQLLELRQRGVKAASLDALGAAAADLQHPFTHEPLRFTRRGALDVLAFAAGVTRIYGDVGRGDTDLVWRVPAGQ